MKKLIKIALNQLGFQINKIQAPPELNPAQLKIIKDTLPFTMTSEARLIALVKSVDYIINRGLEGDFVECGVWRGGSIMAIAQSLSNLGITDRKIWLFDTFDGMTQPTIYDYSLKNGNSAQKLLGASKKSLKNNIHAYAPISEVKKNLMKIDYPFDNFIFVEGPVEKTLLDTCPGKIVLLRLDTDWYESTSTELDYLFPKLVTNGVLIVDDFGDWNGSMKAVTEYFTRCDQFYLMNIIDSTGRLIIKN